MTVMIREWNFGSEEREFGRWICNEIVIPDYGMPDEIQNINC